ncbi:IucA/IucC family protein [Halotalea alkalilenta]|uniref:IucA/IucC family protein n=1 Tax=Halotalea alkalilenta TaxID=376489 RepID=UPI000483B751|nr:IucA/IucC family protein [Halotalea alkalilenta]
MNATDMAARQVMQDLIDCLLAEEFFASAPLRLADPAQWEGGPGRPPAFAALDPQQRIWEWCCDEPEQRFIVAALRPGITQSWEKVPGSPVYVRHGERWHELSPERFMSLVLKALAPRYPDNEKGLALFMEVLRTSVRQTELSLDHRIDTGELLERDNAAFFLAMEQWASLRDRPYHPLAKAKQGLTDEQYRHYQAEFASPVALHWVAVERAVLQYGDGVASQGESPADYLLSPSQQAALHAELQKRGIAESHIALPVHPWQFEQVLEAQLGEAFERGDCQRLEFNDASFYATPSLRSMVRPGHSTDQLKLPMAIHSLGASRYLPAVKMVNGSLSEALLRQARKQDEVLGQTLHVCDESKWWAFMPPGATLFDEAPRHLSAMVRSYPPELLDDPACRLLPMAALGSPLPGSDRHFFDDWLQYRELPVNASSVLVLFRELCHRFFDVNLRMFRLGMLGEVHGQNAVLVWRAGQVQGLLLRDHDSLRLYVPWLKRNGMSDPGYRIKQGHAQTLYHERPEDLLFWLQTLGMQVNLRAIIDTLEQLYGLPAATSWAALREVMEERIAAIGFDDEAREMLHHRLFASPHWPLKLLLRPMVERAGGPGSMPFGKGQVINPFHRIGRVS